MKYKYNMCLCFLVLTLGSISQNANSPKPTDTPILNKPSIVSTHPYGIFFSRWQGNFQTKPLGTYSFNITLESGNVWSPPVTAYIPNNENDRAFVSQFPWHAREFRIDVNSLDAKTLEVQNDGVIKGLRLNFNLPINSKSELKIGLRSFVLTRGTFPFSIITSDDTIEYFHKHIAGGEDPFDRQLYPLNEALIRYKDRNDRVMTIENGDFILSGFELSYYRYPVRFLNGFDFNYGAHMGINTSKFNRSLDIGASANVMKLFSLKNDNTLSAGLSLGGTKNNLIDFSEDNMDFNNNTFIGYLETLVEYSFLSKNKRTRHSFGADFYIQTSLNKKSEFDYLIPTKNGTSLKSWNSGTSNLYRNNNYWTLMYTFARKIATTFYIQQDLTVNNNPDIQTGISLSFNL
ncbi:hypothetical protein [Winogradskyella sp.]|uniref:hypothetical protein n=1 Tax=Winogradskyella sp. TaxID=1883156 RepID=UPI003BAA9536